ncbi:hypothetical protein P154DRAFT_50751 [Amniculicola lignicola CBS 123094]|uniref:Uncharacterized protein n=1 Tax=Amniculicola lignicola CBS 123094 TaxID=1392246 RepID=A0A6A5WYN9_9PLEO|nr:hypothetical protein P154DRAFT_50751 [Amniculicola lignicola CBS 123094]
MKSTTFCAFLLPALAAGRIILLPRPASTLSILVPTPTASNTASGIPIPTSVPLAENLDLRQLGHGAPVTSPLIPAAPLDSGVGGISVTVQWVETHIGSSTTWVPVTVTFKFAAVPSQGPLPGKGVIGMGSLTGEAGAVRTIAVGGAEGYGAGRAWKGAVAVAGFVGMGMMA